MPAAHALAPRPIVEVHGIDTAAGPLDLQLDVGDVLALRGPNGCGKTSLLRSLAGLASARPPKQARLAGRDPRSMPAGDLAGLVQVALQDPTESLVGLTVAGEFRLRGRPCPAELARLAERDVATLSSGQARRVSVSLLGGKRVPLLLLDEPADALDAAAVQALQGIVLEHAKQGAAVIADHGDWVDAVATRTLELAPTQTPPPVDMPAPAPAATPVLDLPPQTVRRGEASINLPALRLGPGLHVVRGPNGCGKSTLLLRLAGLLPGQSHPSGPVPRVSLLLPRAFELFSHETVEAELDGVDPVAAGAWVPRTLRDRHPLSLSAGEAQRLALAKALGRPASLYLLDEPEGHLDRQGRGRLMHDLASLVEEGACIVVATHDPHLHSLAHTVTTLEAA